MTTRLALVALLLGTAACEHAAAPVAPPLFRPGVWPNEPRGFTLLSEYAFADSLPVGVGMPLGDGWFINNANGDATLVREPRAPFSRPTVGQWRYPVGFVAGDAPAVMYRELSATTKELYFGYWWKASSGWQGHPSTVNEISFVEAVHNILVVQMNGEPGGPYHLIVTAEFTTSNGHLANSGGDDPGTRHLFGNVNGGNFVVTPGTWYRIEAYVKTSTTSTSRDGVIRWWVNGTPVGDYTDVNFDDADPWQQFDLSPNWGGVDGVKTQEDFYWFDHVRVSVP